MIIYKYKRINQMKHKFFKIVLILTAVSGIFSISSTPVFADGNFGIESNCDTLLGLTPWSCGVNINDEESLKAGIWTIASNIATDVTVIAAYLVFGFIIYGGYLYMFSGGDPAKVANGKKTITNAFIGLAIVMTAFVILNAIRFILLGADGNLASCDVRTGASCVDPTTMVSSAIQWVIGIAGLISAVFIIFGGISYMTSSGDPHKAQKAKQIIVYALIGLVIVALAEIITAFVTNIIRDSSGTESSLITNQTTISKEVIHENKIT